MRQIGLYTIEDIPLGSGGMGRVYRGYSPNGNEIAVKEILPNFVTDIEYRSRIEREIEFMKMLDNEHIVHIYDHFELQGHLYIVMEMVQGMNIEQYVAQNGPIPWQNAIDYMTQLLLTMQDVHQHNIVHRDIKPENIMLRPNGRICLLDFGVAKNTSANSTHKGTVFGTVIGTDGYMSPEQAQGMSIDHRSDIYGLGCVLYFMLTGYHAFGNMGSELKMQIAITTEEFPRLSDRVKGLPSQLQKILDNAVNKNMMARYQSCREFASDLARLMPGGTKINTGTTNNRVSVSVGRENCDICVGVDNMRVSRHHADIVLKTFTGGEFYVYTDASSNGTTINGQHLQRGMSYNIPKGDNPTIYLANDPSCRLDMHTVAAEIERKQQNMVNDEPPAKPGLEQGASRGSEVGEPAIDYNNHTCAGKITFLSAIKICFTKYAVFKGRAGRAEFWWFALFNAIVTFPLIALFFYTFLSSDYVVSNFILIIFRIYSLGVLLPSLAVTVRRLHDTGKSSWNLLWSLLSIFGFIILIVFYCQKGDKDANRYGPPVC